MINMGKWLYNDYDLFIMIIYDIYYFYLWYLWLIWGNGMKWMIFNGELEDIYDHFLSTNQQ